MTDVYSRIQELPAGRRAALRTRLWDRGRTSTAVGWVDVGEVPASLHQRRLVFIEGLASDSAAYVTAFAVRMTGSVDVAALETALNQVVARHEVLRTVLPVVDGAAIQRICPHQSRPLPLIDLSGLDATTRGRESTRLAKTERTQPFDLASGPLTRYRMVRLGERDFLLLLSFHHAIIDGWSTSVLARELSELYAAAARSRPSTLDPLPLQFSEYARWQADWLESDEAARQLEYWSAKLSGAPEALTLPVDRPRSATPDDTGATCSFTVRADLADALADLATRSGATLYMVLLAAFQVVLARFSGMDDILVGSAVANRRRSEFQKLIGMFANSVVLRGRPYSHLTFAEFLAETRTVCLEAFEYQDLPLDVIVRRLRPGREIGRNPIYQVNFTLQNTPPDVPEIAGVRFDGFDDDRADPSEGARFDLDLGVWITEQGLDCRLTYPVELFEASTVRRLADALCLVLATVVENPDANLGSLPVIPEADLRAILHDFNDTAVDRPATLLVHRLFQEQAAATPEAVAVAVPGQDGTELTYRDLADRASRFAHLLVANGVRRGMVVGVLLERTPELLVALLGVLEAGAAYVPLDPAYPQARLAYMLEDSGARCLVTLPGLLARVGVAEVPTVFVEVDDDGAAPGPLALDQSGDDLMYVMYTSGSTGGAKGVMLAHRQVANYLLWAVRTYRIGEGSGVPVHSSLSFDFTITSIFGSLLAGQRLDLLPETDVPGEALHQYARTASDLTFVKLTPAHLPLIESAARNSRPWTRSLVIGGDALVQEHVSAWRLHSPATHLYNEWGPTEAAVGSMIYDARNDTAMTGPVSIGVPIDNTTIYVLDEQMSPVPYGVCGELYVGGAGVAYGYLNRAELTAAKFVPDPFSTRPGARLYRTGDVGRLQPDGRLEFLGRRDDQVKIRGYRVEPGEVAATIVSHERVRDCAVEVLRTPTGPQLVAFLSLIAAEPASSVRHGVDEATAARVEQWRSLYEDVYDEFGSGAPFFDLTGWSSSYTGDAIPAAEMRAWLDDTLVRIRDLGPKRVLEIGVGSGMILGGVAPHVEHYHGTDFSHAAIGRLRRLCGPGGAGADWSVDLSVSPAHESLAATDTVDTVVMNSVVQYFPSGDYLADVLKRSVDVVSAGGAVFVGDVRNLAVHSLFHTSVQMRRASADARVAEVRADRWRAIDDDRELCVDPRFFASVLAGHPRVTSIRVLPKRGRYRNELSGYRYDVVIDVDGVSTVAEPGWLGWSEFTADRESIEDTLRGDRPPFLAIRDIPNARMAVDRRFAELLADASPEAIVDDLVARARSSADTGVELEHIWDVAERHGYRVEPSWARARPDGSFDAILYRADTPVPVPPMVTGQDWRELVTEPMWRERCLTEQPMIEDYIATRLPEHMRPSDYRFVRALPLTANGKIDHVALRSLAADSADSAAPGSGAPRLSPAEDVIARIWCELLRLRTVRAEDDFFELGGHSLLTFQLGFRLRQAFDVDIPMRLPFEAPVLAELASRVDELVQANAATRRGGGLVRIERTEFMVASSAQERLWFLQELYPHSTQYNVPLFTWITGSLDTVAFARALDAVVSRHEILRTSLVNRDGTVHQRISPVAGSHLVQVDLAGLPDTVATATARRLAGNSHGRPFRLSEGAPFRAALLRLGPERHLLILTLHHIITDGWSTGVLLDEIAELYAAGTEHRPAVLSELAIQYCDYAAWQRGVLTGENAEDLRKYWRDQLDGVLTLPTIPVDRVRPSRPTYRGARLRFRLSSAVTERVHALCTSEQVTPFMVLICPVYGLIRERTGGTDLVIGTDVANRADVATERLIGFFVNQLVLRVDASGNPTWRELLARVKVTALDGYAHQDLPFEQVVRMVNPRRGRDQSPLFQIKVTHNAPQPFPSLPGIDLEPFDFDLPTARFDLALIVTEENGEFTGQWEYDTDLFDERTVQDLLERYLALFEEMVEELTQ